MRRKWGGKRLFALFLSFALIIGMAPVTVAFAGSDTISGSKAMTEKAGEKESQSSGDASSKEDKSAELQEKESNSEKEKETDASQKKEEGTNLSQEEKKVDEESLQEESVETKLATSWESSLGEMKVQANGSEASFHEPVTMHVTMLSASEAASIAEEAAESQAKSEGGVSPNVNVTALGVDIGFYNAAGEEVEPDEPLQVTLTPNSSTFSNEAVSVVHETGDLVADSVTTDSDGSVGFTANSFSAYVMYTVDFTYKGYSWSMAGENSITLSELFSRLGIEERGLDAANVSFTDESLLSVTREGEDWLLTSLAAFQTNETLTVTMTDGTEYIIDVTDKVYNSDKAGSAVDFKDLKVGDILKTGPYTYIKNGTASPSAPTADEADKHIYTLVYRPSLQSYIYRRNVDYVIVLSVSDDTIKVQDLKINKTPFADVKGKTLTYNGQEQELAELVYVNGGKVYYSYQLENGAYTDPSENVPTAKDAGTYTVAYRVVKDNEKSDVYTVKTTIEQGNGSGSVSIDGWAYGQTANTPKAVSNTNGTDHITYSYSGTTNWGEAYGPSENAPTEAGNYKVTASFAATKNYKTCAAKADFTIARADARLSARSDNVELTYGATYSEEELSLGVSKNSDGKVSYESSNPNCVTVDAEGRMKILGAGEATITVSVDQTDNYEAASEMIAVHVAKAEGKGSVSIDGWTYGQTANTPEAASSTNGSDHVTYSYSGTTNAGKTYGPSESAPTEVGSYKLTATFAETDNYEACTAEAGFTIAEAKKESSPKPTDNNADKNKKDSNAGENNKVLNTASNDKASNNSNQLSEKNRKSSNTAVKTGDERDLFFWIALMSICIAGLCEVALIVRKNMKED